MPEFPFDEDEWYVVEIAKRVARRLVGSPKCTPQQIIALGKALEALERLPEPTPKCSFLFGINHRDGDEQFRESYSIMFQLSEGEFEISRGGTVYNAGVGSDSISEPGWFITVAGFRETKGEVYDLDDLVAEYLEAGAEITAED